PSSEAANPSPRRCAGPAAALAPSLLARSTLVHLPRRSVAALHPVRTAPLVVCASPRRPAGRVLRCSGRALAQRTLVRLARPSPRALHPVRRTTLIVLAAASCGPAAALAPSLLTRSTPLQLTRRSVAALHRVPQASPVVCL